MDKTDEAKSIAIANDIENEISKLDYGLTYPEIVRIALVSAKLTIKEIPMYQGNLNPKWAIYDYTIKILEGRLNGY